MRVSTMLRISPARTRWRIARWRADRSDRRSGAAHRGSRVSRHMARRFTGPRPADARSAVGAGGAVRGDAAGRTRHQRPAIAAAQRGRAGAPGAVGAGAVGRPACSRHRQRLDARRFRTARLRLRYEVPRLPAGDRHDAQGVERRAGQRRQTVDVAGLHGRSADPDRGLAQPALDHLRREGNPGLDPVGPLQHARRPRRRDEDLPRGRRHQRRAGECLDRPEGASAIGRAGEGCRIST